MEQLSSPNWSDRDFLGMTVEELLHLRITVYDSKWFAPEEALTMTMLTTPFSSLMLQV